MFSARSMREVTCHHPLCAVPALGLSRKSGGSFFAPSLQVQNFARTKSFIVRSCVIFCSLKELLSRFRECQNHMFTDGVWLLRAALATYTRIRY